MLLYDELRNLRKENTELKFEKACALALACALLLLGFVHFAMNHAPL